MLIIKNPNETKFQMNFKECYFMYSVAYVIISDFIAYIIPIGTLIVFQFLIYFALKKKDRIVNPILDTLKHNNLKKTNTNPSTILKEKKASFDLADLNNKVELKRKTSLNSTIFAKFNETSFNLATSEQNIAEENNNTIITTKSADSTIILPNGINNNNNNNSSFELKNIFIQRQGSFSEVESIRKKKKSIHPSFDINSCNITKTTINNFKKNKKAYKTLLLVSSSIIILWLPWVILWPIEAYCFVSDKECIPEIIYSISYFLEYLNSLMNPLILIIGNQHFRLKFIALFSIFKLRKINFK